MRVGGDNENDDDDDDDEDEEANDDENDDEDVTPGDNAVPAIPLTTAFADIDSATELPPKKKNKREYEEEKQAAYMILPVGANASTLLI